MKTEPQESAIAEDESVAKKSITNQVVLLSEG